MQWSDYQKEFRSSAPIGFDSWADRYCIASLDETGDCGDINLTLEVNFKNGVSHKFLARAYIDGPVCQGQSG